MHESCCCPRTGCWLFLSLAVVALLFPQYGMAEQLPSRMRLTAGSLASDNSVATPSWLSPSGRWDVAPSPRFVSRNAESTFSVSNLAREKGNASPVFLAAYTSLDPQSLPSNQESASPESANPESAKLGEAPEDYSRQFLRQDSVLLKPGEWQFDVGVSYSLFRHDFTRGIVDQPGGPVVDLRDSRLRSRLLLVPLEVRYGVCDGVQAFVNVPFGWSNIEDSFFGYDDFGNEGGLGDITAGLSVVLHRSGGISCDPDVIATLACTAPTGDVSPLQGILEPPNTLLGQGFWFGSWNVLFIHTIDPIVVFYGFGGRHAVSREFQGFEVRHGDQYMYRGGLGFAVNERVTLSASVIGSYITDPYLDGSRIQGLAMEPIAMRFGATIANYCHRRFWDPFVEIGMTPDAPDARVGMTFTY